MTRTRVFALAIAIAPLSLHAQRPSDSLSARIDGVFAAYASRTAPGCAAGVYQDGRVLLTRGYGSANLEYDAPITPSTPFIVGSVSKQFTSAAIALLAVRGKLSLDDDVRRYVPELPDYGARITIRHLVHHTSGLRDFWELVGLSGLRYDDGYRVEDVLALASRQRRLNFTPGDRYLYSNTGYIVLGAIVKRVSGMSLREFAESELFKPLGMTHTHFHDDHTMLVPNRARSYAPSEGGWKLADWNNDLVGQGGLMTTVEDLARWDANFDNGRVGGAEFLARQLERGRLNDGTMLSYAFGLTHGTYRGVPTVEHGGSSGGYRAQITRFPTVHTTVTVLCNAATAQPGVLAQRVADVVLGARLGTRVAANSTAQAGRPVPSSAPVDAGSLARLTGRYYSEELDATYELAAEGGVLVLRRPRAPADTLGTGEGGTVRGRVGSLRFDGDPGQPAPSFTLDAGRVREVKFVRKR